MNKAEIKAYLKSKQIDPQQRIDRNFGGQFIENFLHEFAHDLRSKIVTDCINKLKELKT